MASGSARTIRIKFDGSAAGLVAAAAEASAALEDVDREASKQPRQMTWKAPDTKDTENALGRVQSLLSRVSTGFVSAASSAVKFSLIGNTLVSLVQFMSQAVGVIGLLPGGLLIGAAALGTMKLGADGLKKSFDGLFTPLQKSVSAVFEKQLPTAVKNFSGIVKDLTPDFDGIAKSISGVITRISDMAKSSENIGNLHTILGSTSDTVTNLGYALTPVIKAFIQIGAVGAPIIARLTAALIPLADKFAAFIDQAAKSGQLATWINTGIQALKTMGPVIEDIGGIFKALGTAIGTSGEGMQSAFTIITSALNKFLNSVQGQQFLKSLLDLMNDIATTVGPILVQAFEDIAGVFKTLQPYLKTIVDQLGGALLSALKSIGPELPTIADALGKVAVPIITGLIPTLPTVARLIGSMGAIIVLVAPIVLVLVSALQVAVGAVLAFADAITGHPVQAMQDMKNGFITSAQTMHTALTTNWGQMATELQASTLGMAGTAQNNGNAMAANFGGQLNRMPGMAQNAGSQAAANIGSQLGKLGGIGNSAGGSLNNSLNGAYAGAQRGADQGGSGIVSTITRWIHSIPSQLGDLNSLLLGAGKSILTGLANGIVDGFNKVKSIVSNIAPWIAANKGPLSYDRQLLIPAGQGIMGGLLTGLTSGWKDVQSFVGGVAGGVDRAVGAASGLSAALAPAGGLGSALAPDAGPPIEVHVGISQNQIEGIADARVVRGQKQLRSRVIQKTGAR